MRQKKLDDLIPKGNLKVYRRIYDTIKKIDIKKYYRTFPSEDISTIKNLLKSLSFRGFIKHEEHVRISDNLDHCLQHSSKAMAAYFIQRIFAETGNRRDLALDVFIYLAASDLLIYEHKPRYGKIANYLLDNNLIDRKKECNDELIRRRYERIVREKGEDYIADVLNGISCFCSAKNPLIPKELDNQYDQRGVIKTTFADINISLIPPEYNPISLI